MKKYIVLTKGKPKILTGYTNNFDSVLKIWHKYIKVGEKEVWLLEEYEKKFGKLDQYSSGNMCYHKPTFYDSDEWKAIRKVIFDMYGYNCMKCQTKNAEFHIDHIKPRFTHKNLSLDINNLQVLCKKCNIEKSFNNENDYRTLEHKQKLSAKYI